MGDVMKCAVYKCGLVALLEQYKILLYHKQTSFSREVNYLKYFTKLMCQ